MTLKLTSNALLNFHHYRGSFFDEITHLSYLFCRVHRRSRQPAMKEWSTHSAGLLPIFTALLPQPQRTVLSYLMSRKERLSVAWLRLNIFWLLSFLLIWYDGVSENSAIITN